MGTQCSSFSKHKSPLSLGQNNRRWDGEGAEGATILHLPLHKLRKGPELILVMLNPKRKNNQTGGDGLVQYCGGGRLKRGDRLSFVQSEKLLNP